MRILGNAHRIYKCLHLRGVNMDSPRPNVYEDVLQDLIALKYILRLVRTQMAGKICDITYMIDP